MDVSCLIESNSLYQTSVWSLELRPTRDRPARPRPAAARHSVHARARLCSAVQAAASSRAVRLGSGYSSVPCAGLSHSLWLTRTVLVHRGATKMNDLL